MSDPLFTIRSFLTCKEMIATIKKKIEDGGDPAWLPKELEEILMLLPRTAQAEEFRVCALMITWIKAARVWSTTNWLPEDKDISALLEAIYSEE